MKYFYLLTIFLLFHLNLAYAQITINYIPDNANIANPERGFYHHTETHSNDYDPLVFTVLQDFRPKENITLIFRVFYLEDFKTKPISNTYLNLIQQDLDLVREAGLKCIMRFAYNDMEGLTDASKAIMLQHLDQLKPIFEKNADVIDLVQAGFIGSWGEWYYTTQAEFGIPPNQANYINRGEVLEKILSVLPKSRMVQVRTPAFKQHIFGTTDPLEANSAHKGSTLSRTGQHNDCFLASDDDYGTYVDIQADKAYLSTDCLYVPNGGETCNPSTYSNCINALSDLSYLRYSFLNIDYEPEVLNGWVTNGCMDEIKKKLGYRFKLINGEFTDPVKSGDSLLIKLKLFNEGWAAPFNPRGVEIVLRSLNNPTEKYIYTLTDDPRFWLPGDTAVIAASIPIPANITSGLYDVFLNLPDTSSSLKDRAEYSIRLANENVWEDSTGYNHLYQVNIADVTSAKLINKNNFGFSICPNPNKGYMQIDYEIEDLKKAEFIIIDVMGRVVKIYPLDEEKRVLMINESDLLEGVYFCGMIIDGRREVAVKLVVGGK